MQLALKEHAQEAMVFIAGRAINEILNATPAETPGRMQAAWIDAFRKLGDFGAAKEHAKALSHIEGLHKREAADENDKSWTHGRAAVGGGKKHITATLTNTLDFASTVEHGGVIEVGVDGNVGPKLSKTFPGQLNSPRKSDGHGFLRWIDENGSVHVETRRNMTGSNSIRKAIPKARKAAKRFGFK